MRRGCTTAALLIAVMLISTGHAQAAPTARGLDKACPPGDVPEDELFDVPASNVHEFPVDCVVWWAVALGRSASSYDPAANVERGQMASFLARLILETGGELPDQSVDAFTDDNGSTHEPTINRLAAAGLVAGKGSGRFDPRGIVERGQMATFLVNAIQHRIGSALPAGSDAFSDDNGTTHEANINKAAMAGITGGSASGGYEPARLVARDAMASFLARSLDLLVTEGGATTPPPAGSPGDTKNCSDFASFSHAKTWFDHYYPAHGDVAMLDADNDLVPCEELR